MAYLFVKTLHLFSILAWTAGLIYLPRLLAEVVADAQSEAERRRVIKLAEGLCRFTLIAAAPVMLTGAWLWFGFELKGGWLHYKATLAFGLLALSHTQAIASFGLVLSVGVFISFLLAPLAMPARYPSKEISDA